MTNLSRSNFKETTSTAPTKNASTLAYSFLDGFNQFEDKQFDLETNPYIGNVESSKIYLNLVYIIVITDQFHLH